MGQATNDADRAAVAEALEKNRQETMRLVKIMQMDTGLGIKSYLPILIVITEFLILL